MDFLLTYGLGRMKHFSFVYFSMLLHDSEEGCSHFVLEGLISLMVDKLRGTAFLCPDSENQNGLFSVCCIAAQDRQIIEM